MATVDDVLGWTTPVFVLLVTTLDICTVLPRFLYPEGTAASVAAIFGLDAVAPQPAPRPRKKLFLHRVADEDDGAIRQQVAHHVGHGRDDASVPLCACRSVGGACRSVGDPHHLGGRGPPRLHRVLLWREARL